MTKNDILVHLVREIVTADQKTIVMLFENVKDAKEFRADLNKKLEEIPIWLIGKKRVDNAKELHYSWTRIRFLNSPIGLRGHSVDEAYIVGDMTPSIFDEYKKTLAPHLIHGADLEYFYLFDI